LCPLLLRVRCTRLARSKPVTHGPEESETTFGDGDFRNAVIYLTNALTLNTELQSQEAIKSCCTLKDEGAATMAGADPKISLPEQVIHLKLAFVHLNLNNFHLAVKHARRTMTLAESQGDSKIWTIALNYLAEALCAIGSPKDACDLLDTVDLQDQQRNQPLIWLDPDHFPYRADAIVRLNRCITWIVLGSLDKAADYLNQLVTDFPTFNSARQGLAYIRLRQGRNEEALLHLRCLC
jgi:tetratricopeptide (TPR) repeat protein